MTSQHFGPLAAEGQQELGPAAALAQAMGELRLVARGARELEVRAEPASAFELAALARAADAALSSGRRVQWGSSATRDIATGAARVARCAADALRALAEAVALPTGSPVDDVPRDLLWAVADLTARLRSAGRIGPTGRPHDPGVVARDAADLVITTYRRWRGRVRGSDGGAVARLAVTAAFASGHAGLATVILNDDDACGLAARPRPHPPGWEQGATAPIPEDVRRLHPCDSVLARRERCALGVAPN